MARGGRGARPRRSPSWRRAPRSRPGPARSARCCRSATAPRGVDEGRCASCRELGQRTGAAIGVSELHDSAGRRARAYREALDAATIGRALLRRRRRDRLLGGRRLPLPGAHRAPRTRRATGCGRAVDRLIDYDRRRRTALLDTLERYLSERRSVIESARALFIHPNTLRQRLGRIEELTGLNLDEDDLLSLELAIKLARLHGRPGAADIRSAAAQSRPEAPVPGSSSTPGTPGSWPAAARAGAPGTRACRPRRGCGPGRRPSRSRRSPSSSASWRIRLVDLRVPTTWPSASMPLRSRRLTASATILRCSSHSLGREQAGVWAGRTRRRAPARSRTRARWRRRAAPARPPAAIAASGIGAPRRRAGSARTLAGSASRRRLRSTRGAVDAHGSDAPAIGAGVAPHGSSAGAGRRCPRPACGTRRSSR